MARARKRALGAADRPTWSRYLERIWRAEVVRGNTVRGLAAWSRGRCIYCGEVFVPDTSYDGWPRCTACQAC